jgi:hypothetical protein
MKAITVNPIQFIARLLKAPRGDPGTVMRGRRQSLKIPGKNRGVQEEYVKKQMGIIMKTRKWLTKL